MIDEGRPTTVPKAFVFSPGDSRQATAAWIQPHLDEALERLPGLLTAAGYEVCILTPSLVQSQTEAMRLARQIKRLAQPGDVIMPLCIGWGLPGIAGSVFTYLKSAGAMTKLRTLLVSNLLEQYPGYVQAAAIAHPLAEMSLPFDRVIIMDWDDETVVAQFAEFREMSLITRPWSGAEPEVITPTVDDVRAAREVLRLMRGNIYGPIGGSSMLMGQGYPPRWLLERLGIGLQDIGSGEFFSRVAHIPEWRAKAAMKFCFDHGLENVDVPEDQLLEQMRYLLTYKELIGDYGLSFGGIQGQFDMTRIAPADDLSTALIMSICRPESDGRAIVWATENDAWGALTMRLLQVAVQVVHARPWWSVGFHDLRHILPNRHGGVEEWLIALLNSGALNAYDLTGRNDTLDGVFSMVQDPAYMPHGGGCSGGEMVAQDHVTWARLMPVGWQGAALQMGCGEIVPVSSGQRLEHYGLLDPNWPLGLLRTYCDPWRFLTTHVPNHTHTVPVDGILGVLAAVSEILNWGQIVMGATKPSA